MSLVAEADLKTISTTEMAYLKGRPADAKYGACYYEINSKDLSEEEMQQILTKDQENYDEIEIQLQITKAEGLNVYLYGGSSRFDAKTPVTENND